MKQYELNTILGCILTIISFALFSTMIREAIVNPSFITILLLMISTVMLSKGGIFLFDALSKKKNVINAKDGMEEKK